MADPEREYLFGPFRLHPLEGLFRDNRAIALRPKALLLLAHFAQHPGRVLSTASLLSDMWTDTIVDARGLKAYVSQLRKALGDAAACPTYIETLSKRGYRFTADVRAVTAAPRREWPDSAEPGSPAPADGVRLDLAPAAEMGPRSAPAGTGQPRSKPEAPAGLETFVGRELELSRLDELLREAVDGAGRIIFITGEPGIGKTTLAHEFLRRVAHGRTGALISSGRCVEHYGPSEAYLPFLDALGTLLSGPERGRVMAVLQANAPTWCLQLPAAFASAEELLQLLRNTIGATKDRMLRELGDALTSLTADMAVVMLLEDLHWADPSSIDVLRYLSLRLPGQRLLIVGTLRPEDVERSAHPLKGYRADMVARGCCEEVALGLLTVAHLARYLDVRFAQNDFPADLARILHGRTEGHPLFTTSLVQFLVERGDIARVGDRWALTRPLTGGDLRVPAGVCSIFRRQIDALEPEDRQALQYASVEGEEFLSTVLASLTGIEEVTLQERLDRLELVNRLIKKVGEEEMPDGLPAVRYRFTHALHQNVLYADLVSGRRISLHRQVAEQLLRHYGDLGPRIAAKLAMHFEQGRDFARAVEYRIRTGDNAAQMYANADAERHYTDALSLSQHLPEDERRRHELTIHRKRGTACLNLSRFDEAVAEFGRMRDLARALNAPSLEAAALNGTMRGLFYSHRFDDMARSTDEASQVAERSGDPAILLETMTLIGLKRVGEGDLREAKSLLDETIATARRIGDPQSLCAALAWRGGVHYWQSEYDDADRLLIEARDMAAEQRDGFVLLFSLFIQGLTRGNQGRMSDGLDCLGEARRIAERNGDQFWSPRLPNCIGWIYRELQDFDRAMEYDRQGLGVGGAHHVLEAKANALINLGIDYTELRHQPDNTLSVFREVQDIIAHDAWFRWRYEIRMQAATAAYWLREGDLGRAEAYAENLDTMATHVEAWKYVAIAGLLHARIALARGDDAAALDRLAGATDRLRQYPAPLVAWRVNATLGRLEMTLGNLDAAAQAFARGAETIRRIAASVRDETLRATFLASPAVSEVLDAAAASVR